MSREIRDQIDVAAPRERVFDCLTDPRELLVWWTTPDYPATHWSLDARVGGQWLSRCRAPDGHEFALGGEIVEFRRPEVLEVTWWDERYPNLPVTRVRYELQDIPGGCRVRLLHTGFDDVRVDFDDYDGGWRSVLGKLRQHASGEGEFRGNRDIAIEVPDLARARGFYVGALGFAVRSESASHLELDGGAFRLWVKATGRVRPFMPSLDVRDVGRARSLVRAAGGRVVDGDGDSSEGFVFEDPFGLTIDVVRSAESPPEHP